MGGSRLSGTRSHLGPRIPRSDARRPGQPADVVRWPPMNAVKQIEVPVSLIGHPFAPIGKGEDMRCYYRGLKAIGIRPQVVNVYGGKPRDCELERELADDLRATSGGGIDIFCINGDEVEPVLAHLGTQRAAADFSIVVPFWELSRYPAIWARQLERFDEIWVASAFIRDAITPELDRR